MDLIISFKDMLKVTVEKNISVAWPELCPGFYNRGINSIVIFNNNEHAMKWFSDGIKKLHKKCLHKFYRNI